MQSDRETVTQLVKKLKEEIKHVNAFVILFNGQVGSILTDLNVFIGPRSDHSLPMSVTDSLTDSLTN